MNSQSIAQRLIGLLPKPDQKILGTELSGMIEDAHAAGDNIGPLDTFSIGWLVARRWGQLGFEHLPLVVAGVPLSALTFIAILNVTRNHFEPWRAFADVESTTAIARALRPVVSNIAPIALLLCLLTGARAVQYLRRGSYVLPGGLLGISYVMTSQGQLFLERTEWAFKDNLPPASVDQVSPYSILALGTVLAIPLGFLAIDLFLSIRGERDQLPPFALSTAGPLTLGLIAISFVTLPYLIPLGTPLIWKTNLSRRTKLTVTVTVSLLTVLFIAAVAYEFYVEGLLPFGPQRSHRTG